MIQCPDHEQIMSLELHGLFDQIVRPTVEQEELKEPGGFNKVLIMVKLRLEI